MGMDGYKCLGNLGPKPQVWCEDSWLLILDGYDIVIFAINPT